MRRRHRMSHRKNQDPAGTKQVDMGNDTFAQFYPAVDSDAGRAAGENYDTRSIDEMKDLFETERIEEIKK